MKNTDYDDFEKKFAQRLTSLRLLKGVSARSMSLDIGQSAGYINNIENGKSMPSMMIFCYICDYLDISPRDFLDFDIDDPCSSNDFLCMFNDLDHEEKATVISITQQLLKNKL
ncbi:MAG: helix-turn-helix transcriptional regulator [Ruminococcus sp.]|nr:helix-turn-helix transcriptional regulator [Ruminococcus sp.]